MGREVTPPYHRTNDLNDALDALEAMCWQYLSYDSLDENELCHAFMSAGEFACGTLCRLRPERWRDTGAGMEYIGGD